MMAKALKPKMRWPLDEDLSQDLVLKRVAPEMSFKTKVYGILKQAVIGMDIYGSAAQTWLDERQLSEKLGVSRTPVREAIAMLEQEGFVRSVPRKGIMVLKKTKREVIGMVQKSGGIDYAAGKMMEYRKDALAILHTYPDSPARQAMEELVNYVIDRKY